MNSETFFLDSKHPVSQRYCVFEDDGVSAWLYLTDRETLRPIADAWVHNRAPAPPMSDIKKFYAGPPPAAIGYTTDDRLCESPASSGWQFQWAQDGESVALFKDGHAVALCSAESKHGWSINLIKDGPWGFCWDVAKYAQLFKTARAAADAARDDF